MLVHSPSQNSAKILLGSSHTVWWGIILAYCNSTVENWHTTENWTNCEVCVAAMSHPPCIALGSLLQFHPVLNMIFQQNWIRVQDMPILSLRWKTQGRMQKQKGIQFQEVKGKVESGKLRIKKKIKITRIGCKLKSDLLRLTYLLCVTQNKPRLHSRSPQIDEEEPHYGHLKIRNHLGDHMARYRWRERGRGRWKGERGGRKRVTACCHATSQYANEHQNEEVVRDKVPLRSSCQSKRNHHRRGTKRTGSICACECARVCVCARMLGFARMCICLHYEVQK